MPPSVYEYAGNPHVHTPYSDGEALHAEVAEAAGQAGLDFVIVTDHNVWVDGCEGYYDRVLLLVGEELHDVRLHPRANHLLAYNVEGELAPRASKPQQLIDEVNERGGFCFLAHPYEYSSPVGPDLFAIPWADWDVTGFAGLEIWNYMSEFKALLRNKLAALLYTRFPAWGISGPFGRTLGRWDHLLSEGRRVSAIGGADAHGNSYSMGRVSRVVFPYPHLFRCVNTHVLTQRPVKGVLDHDKALIYEAMRAGHTWVGYDLPASTSGFRFRARTGANHAIMGDAMKRAGAIVFDVETPQTASIHLVRNGKVVARARANRLRHTTAEAGIYRVEAYRNHQLGRRGWIFSSPIYIT
jgi:hypothetical protein